MVTNTRPIRASEYSSIPAVRRFVRPERQTPEFRAAVEAVARLIPARTDDRAYAAAVADHKWQQYQEQHGVRPAKHACIWRLIGKRCLASRRLRQDDDWEEDWSDEWPDAYFNCTPPGTDHPQLWVKDRKPYSYTSEPYGLSGQKLAKVLAFCEHFRLEVNIDADPSWHFPGNTLFVEFTKKESEL
ncbi:MAG: hypothetical protein M3120_01390 [Pseudomonadota bacterium]|nr:hypothetical protein [Pseudomonadota bacterium]